jgi:GH15 family glucan-1,4-alpha-glucosidase
LFQTKEIAMKGFFYIGTPTTKAVGSGIVAKYQPTALVVGQAKKMVSKWFIITIILTILCLPFLRAQDKGPAIQQSYFKLTTSNGLVVAVYNAKENRIDDVYPHIFACYDSGNYVYPFVGNIQLNSLEKPLETFYLDNTHVITAKYNDFTVNYFTSFTRNDRIFYIVIRGEKEKIERLTFLAETSEGAPVSGITLLENHLQDLPIVIKGHALTGSFIRQYDNAIYEKYFLYSLTDSLLTDDRIINKAIGSLSMAKNSLLDDEVHWMKNFQSSCIIPDNLTQKEKNLVEQSISILKMSQMSDYEIFSAGHGQIMASLRPGLWHVAWVRDGSYAIQAMTRLGMYKEAKKALEFMLKAPSGLYKNYIYTDGRDYGPGVDYQISLTRYFGNGKEECDYNEYGPNIEYDDWGLFLCAYSDYVQRSNDSAFYKRWNKLMCSKVADATVACIDTNGLIRHDSGPWEHHLEMTKQYTFTSGVCARGLEMFASLQQKYHLPYEKYQSGADRIRQGLVKHMLCDGKYFKGNAEDQHKTDREYYDAGAFEIFANGLMRDKSLFLSHMAEYDIYMRIQGARPGYIRLNTVDPYENQEWVFINLRLSLAWQLFGQKDVAAKLLNYVTEQAALNYNIIPEMYSNKLQMSKVPEDYMSGNIWCNCIRDKDGQYIGAIPMVGYGSGAYIIALYNFYGK